MSFPKREGFVNIGVRAIVDVLNCGQSGRRITTLMLIGDLAWHVRICLTHCTAKDQGGLQYTDCPTMSWDRNDFFSQ